MQINCVQHSDQARTLALQDSRALMVVDYTETAVNANDNAQNGGFSEAEALVQYSQVCVCVCVFFFFCRLSANNAIVQQKIIIICIPIVVNQFISSYFVVDLWFY